MIFFYYIKPPLSPLLQKGGDFKDADHFSRVIVIEIVAGMTRTKK
jgi:hypothetical protein